MDLFANRIVGYSISNRMTAQLAVDALDNAVTRRRIEGHEVAGCILHADRGSQFRSRTMGHALNRHGMVGSMGRVGAAGDNAAMESFWSLLQTNVLNQRRRATQQELRIAIIVWIERTYHRQRPQDSLGGLTPIEYENETTTTAAAAASTDTATSTCITPLQWGAMPYHSFLWQLDAVGIAILCTSQQFTHLGITASYSRNVSP